MTAAESFTLHQRPYRLRGGYYDIGRRAELRAELDSLEPHSDIILDLAATQQVDCSCLGVMVAKLNEWRERDSEMNLRLLNVGPGVARVLNISRLDEAFIVERTR